ncbi:helix-turn-helix transcriptional regulator [Rossellomorea marisflavi]|uniref:helix-turn-helix transcriptional regulator n=1 Tax=Rossellomorea marisflavi TaxID=189381 RepID=UPI00207A289E|nr:helix-turn-helix domain-containing protein [Rossellomorea marisflavi]USK91509.1 helix-turn-helix domain-containing protein [Rossellomorea marisflavi]
MIGKDLSFKDFDALKDYLKDEIITTQEVADLLGCSRQNIKQLVDHNTLVPVKITGRDRLFLKSEVNEYKTARASK